MIRENRPTSDPTRLYLHVYILSLLNVTDEILIDTNTRTKVLVVHFELINTYIYIYIYIYCAHVILNVYLMILYVCTVEQSTPVNFVNLSLYINHYT